jgi:hypothetical protein
VVRLAARLRKDADACCYVGGDALSRVDLCEPRLLVLLMELIVREGFVDDDLLPTLL